jgi:hypothetical protein
MDARYDHVEMDPLLSVSRVNGIVSCVPVSPPCHRKSRKEHFRELIDSTSRLYFAPLLITLSVKSRNRVYDYTDYTSSHTPSTAHPHNNESKSDNPTPQSYRISPQTSTGDTRKTPVVPHPSDLFLCFAISVEHVRQSVRSLVLGGHKDLGKRISPNPYRSQPGDIISWRPPN